MQHLDPPPCDVLKEIWDTGRVQLPGGGSRPAVLGIGVKHATALYHLVLREKPDMVVETGMGQGVSTLSILCALQQTGGRMISIDPYPRWTRGREAALNAVQRAGYADRHRLIEEPSEIALPRLVSEGLRIQFAYVDGNHDVEHAFLDFFYMDRLLREGGVMGFNNAGWRPVFQVIRHLKRTRPYKELTVGLQADYGARNPLLSLMRRLMRWPRQDRYFRKTVPGSRKTPG